MRNSLGRSLGTISRISPDAATASILNPKNAHLRKTALPKKFKLHNLTQEESSDSTEDNRCPEERMDDLKNETAPERLSKLSQFIDTLHSKTRANDIQIAIEKSMKVGQDTLPSQIS